MGSVLRLFTQIYTKHIPAVLPCKPHVSPSAWIHEYTEARGISNTADSLGER